MSDLREKLEDLKAVIRSLLLPYQSGLPLRLLDANYYEIEGRRIQFRELGHNTLISLLRSMPDAVVVQERGNEIYLWPVANEETRHIQNLVQKQKKSTNSPRYARPRPKIHLPSNFTAKTGQRQNSLPPRLQQTTGAARRMIYNHLNLPLGIPFIIKDHMKTLLSRFPGGIQLDNLKWAYIKNCGLQLEPGNLGFLTLEDLVKTLENDNILKLRMHQNSFTVFPVESQYTTSQTASNTERVADSRLTSERSHNSHQSSVSDRPTQMSAKSDEWANNSKFNPKILNNMRRLIDLFPGGILITELSEKYKEVTGGTLDISDLGFHDVQSLVNELEDVFRVAHLRNGDWLLTDARLPPKAETPKIETPTGSREPDEIPEDVQQNLYDLLKFEPDGFLLSEIERDYKNNFEENLPWKKLHYENLESFMRALNFSPPVRLVPSGLNDFRIVLSGKDIPAENIRQYPAAPPKRKSIPHDAVGLGEVYNTLKIGTEKENDFFPVLVSEVDSPGKVWLQLLPSEHVRVNEELDSLMDALEVFYTSSAAEEYEIPDECLIVSMVVAVLYPPEQNWHRGCIVGKKGPTTFQIFYFDYGTVYVVEKDLLRLLTKSFNTLPAQAFAARLSRLKPLGDCYSEESRQRLLTLTCDKPLMAHITSRQYHNMISLILCDTSNEEDIYINTVLLEERLVSPSLDSDEPVRKPFSITSQSFAIEEPQNHAHYFSTPSPVQMLDLTSPISTPLPPPVFSNPFRPAAPRQADPMQGYYGFGGGATSVLNTAGARFPTVNSQVFQPSGVRMEFDPHARDNILDLEIIKRVQEKAKKKLTIPQATVGPMQYSRTDNSSPETLISLTPARNVEYEIHPQASSVLPLMVQRSAIVETNLREEIEVPQPEEDIVNVSASSTLATAQQNDGAQRQARYCKRVTFQDQQFVVHLINFYGQPCFSSADVSLFIFVIDIVRKILRMRKYPACHITATREEHTDLFAELEQCGATGFTDKDTPSDKVLLYVLSDVTKILMFLDYQGAAVLEQIELLSQEFDPNDEYWNTPLEEAEEYIVEDAEGLEEQLKKLMKELNVLALSVYDSDRLVEVSQGIHSIQSKLKKIHQQHRQPVTKCASELAQEFLDKVNPVTKSEDDACRSTCSPAEDVTAVPATSTTAVASIEERVIPTTRAELTSNRFSFVPRVGAAPGFPIPPPTGVTLHALTRHPSPQTASPLVHAIAATQLARHAVTQQFHPNMMMHPQYVFFQDYNYSTQTQMPPPLQQHQQQHFQTPFNNTSYANGVNYTKWQ